MAFAASRIGARFRECRVQRRDRACDDPMVVDTLVKSSWTGSCWEVCWNVLQLDKLDTDLRSVGLSSRRRTDIGAKGASRRGGGGGGSNATSHEKREGHGKSNDNSILESSRGRVMARVKRKGNGKRNDESDYRRNGNSSEDDGEWQESVEVEIGTILMAGMTRNRTGIDPIRRINQELRKLRGSK